jgi:hypothetical protein
MTYELPPLGRQLECTVAYVMRWRVEDTFSTRATRATPFQYQGYSKATETRNSVFRGRADKS